MDIERLVEWALRDQGLGFASAAPARHDSLVELGTRIDVSRGAVASPSIALWTDDSALVVKAAIDALPSDARVLVFQYGRAGLRPDWAEEGYGDWQQVRDRRGRPRWIWEDAVNRTGAKQPMMEFVGMRPELVDWHRAQYGLWWQALADLVPVLNGKVGEVTGPAAPKAPWESNSQVLHPT